MWVIWFGLININYPPPVLMSEGQQYRSMNLKYFFVFSLIIIFLITTSLLDVAISQPSFPDDPDQIPVDGGVALMFAAGSVYAIKKIRQKRILNEE